uniref:carboxylesterase 5A-like isoform X2 n=1 Tax=Ciona intestinalis TaxID=7719 RepID=UPI000180C93F|nr:carboxylesterase 5A-like isoform X2 [Ciona intestinalis]|eukprot:XP_002127407.1 carboxylesterase 5A-like isoform X2 [Ciona intestinalis]
MSESPCVETAKGPVRGKVAGSSKYPNAKQVYRFSSIPFAKPPVGDLRFERPQDAEPWSEVLDATKEIASPMQDLSMWEYMKPYVVFEDVDDKDFRNLQEDCLYLNVFTNNLDAKANLPVLVWLYGGGLSMGSAVYYDAKTICSMQDVVVVIPNYRVNVFGFFTAGKDTKWKGNMGLYDQLKALEWVKHNVKSFGGNPDNVTIFGESAGGLSVGCHVLSPLSRGYFHRAISHSGTATMPTMMKTEYTNFRKCMLEHLKITATDPDEMVAALKKVSAEKILEAQGEAYKKFPMGAFGLTVDGEFILGEGTETITKPESIAPVPYIVGCNNTEVCGILSVMIPEFATGATEEGIEGYLKMLLQAEKFPSDSQREAVGKLLKEKYIQNYSVDDKHRWSKTAGEMFADMWFIIPSLLQANAHADAGHPTYFYYMTQAAKVFHSKEYVLSGELKPKVDFCECDHGDDLIYTFGYPHSTTKLAPVVKFTDEERKMSEQWMNYIANFAKTGNPNTGDKEVPLQWPIYKSSERNHLTAQFPFGIGQNLSGDKFKFHTETIAEMKK